MNSQMTFFAFGRKYGFPVDSARGTPSRCSSAPSARPVKPRPMSARNARRLTRPQQLPDWWLDGIAVPSANGDEVIVIQKHKDQVLAGALHRIGRGRHHGISSGRERRELRRLLEQHRLIVEKSLTAGLFGGCRCP